MAPHIDRKNLQKKIIRSGQTLKIEADIKGEPPPVVTWKLKDSPLKSTEKIKIDNEDYKTSFTILKMKRADAGTYTVFAKNDSGTDQVDVEIEVLCKSFLPLHHNYSILSFIPFISFLVGDN